MYVQLKIVAYLDCKNVEMAASSANHFQLSFSSVVRGFHLYQAVWIPVLNAEYVHSKNMAKKLLMEVCLDDITSQKSCFNNDHVGCIYLSAA